MKEILGRIQTMIRPRSPFIALFAVIVLLLMGGCATVGASSEGGPPGSFAPNGYPNGDLLVSTQWLQENLNSKDLVVVDVRTKDYAKPHIPGAINLAPLDFVMGKAPGNIPDIEARLTAFGLRRDMKFVIYDDVSEGWGAAGRFFWLFEYLGCTDVHVLDGGWSKWVAEGRAKQADQGERRVAGKFVAAPKKDIASTARYIRARSGDKNFALIDARSIEEFNGWQLYGEPRGGHIPGAVNIPYTTLFSQDKTIPEYKDLKSLLETRGINPDKEVAAYCLDGRRSGFVYFILRLMGYKNPSNYAGTIREWAAEPSLPMEKLAHYEKLVYAAWVKDLIDGKNPPTYPGRGYVILDVRSGFSVAQALMPKNNGYIPRAITIHPSYMEHGKNTAKYYPNYSHGGDGDLLPPGKLLEAIADLGITKDTTVVVYGNGRIMPMVSSRVVWALMYAGVEDVRLLNGSFTAWEAAGYPIASAPADPKPVEYFGAKAPLHPEYYASMDYVRSISRGERKDSFLVDVRADKEYDGRTNIYNFFTKKGHIPGATWHGDWDILLNMKDNTYRSYPEVRQMWKQLGITPDKEPVFYCGTGWRSSIGFFHAYLMGFDRMRNYGGSFYEWSWYPENKIAMEPPPK
jgi:3-mercaptopyruvate sulfurtransferase SseA